MAVIWNCGIGLFTALALALTSDLSSAVHSHVIDQHLLGKFSSLVGIAGPISADSKIQDDEEGMVIYPLCACGKIVWAARGIQMIIDIESNLVRFPFDCKQMEVIAELIMVWQRKG